MISFGRRLSMFAVAVAAMGAMSACTSTTDTAGSPATSAPATNTATATATSGSTAPAGGDVQQFCALVGQQKSFLQGTAIAGLLSGGGTADAWKTYLEQADTMNQQLVAAAPAEIQPSIKTLQDTTAAVKTAMEAANYDVTKVGVTKLLGILQSPDRVTASATLTAYVKTNCNIDLTTAS